MKTVNKTTWQSIADTEYISGLKRGDGKITEAFFYGLCHSTLSDVRFSLMNRAVDYDDLVNELYIYLSAADWHYLNTFEGKNSCTLRSWLVRITWRYFLSRRRRLLGLVTLSADSVRQIGAADLNLEIQMDVRETLRRMPNRRYAQTLTWMLLDGIDAEEVAARLGTTLANVYNIKHRAIVQFVEIYNADE